MNAKEYNQRKERLYKNYSLSKTDLTHEVMLKIPFGVVYIASEWSPKIKVANIHSKLIGDIKTFKEKTGYNISTYNGKFNQYFDNPEDCLNELEEFIGNLIFISGKNS